MTSTREETFWAIIERGRELIDEEPDECFEVLVGALVEMGDERAIFDFQRTMEEQFARAYHWDLWGVAYIINGGCSDDGFDYFMGWLICKGRAVFEAALADPQSLAEVATPGVEVEFPELWTVATCAYEELTGREDFYERAEPVSRTLQGKPWNEDQLEARFPVLAGWWDGFQFDDEDE